MKLPKNLKYLEAPATKYATNDVLWVPKAYRYVKRLKPAAIESLARLYRTIQERKDARRIGNWLQKANLDTRAPEGAVWRLGILFEHLAELGVEPFCERSVDIFEADDVLVDFSKVPPGFQFLIPAAAEFGHAWHEDLISELLESIASDQKKKTMLKKAAARLLSAGADDLQTWLDRHDGSDDPAAERVGNLLRVLDHAGLHWRNDRQEPVAPDMLRKQWATLLWPALGDLVGPTLETFSADECFRLITAALERLSPADRESALWMLQRPRTSKTLDWIEANLRGRIDSVDSWAQLAALSRLSWSRVRSWIDRGGPLRRVAAAALRLLSEYDPGIMQELKPKLLNAPSVTKIANYLKRIQRESRNAGSRREFTKTIAILEKRARRR